MSTDPTARRWPVARLLCSTHLVFLGLVWAALLAIVAAVTLAIALLGQVSGSVLDPAVSIVRWFALGYGTVLTGTLLPTYVAHGQTRRDAMAQLSAFILVGGALFAALLTAGYALEGLGYRLAGWPHELRGERPFAAPDEFGLIFLTLCGVLLAWTITGALLGASFYRSRDLGVTMVPVALVLVVAASVGVGFGGLPFVGRAPAFAELPPALGVALWTASCLLGLAATWGVVRELPLRTGGA